MNNQILDSRYPLLDRGCYWCDSHHMKALVADIRLLSTGKMYRGTGRTVGEHPSTCSPKAHWNETWPICI